MGAFFTNNSIMPRTSFSPPKPRKRAMAASSTTGASASIREGGGWWVVGGRWSEPITHHQPPIITAQELVLGAPNGRLHRRREPGPVYTLLRGAVGAGRKHRHLRRA